MKCRECRQARRFAQGSVFCLIYGMIIRDKHECGRKGGEPRGRDDSDSEEQREGAGLHEDSSGAA